MRLFKVLLYSLIFGYSSLLAYTSLGNKADVVNSRSDYYNGSCSYVSSGYARSIYENFYNNSTNNFGSCSPSSLYDNYSELLSLNSNPDFVFASSSASTEYEYTHCETNGLEGINGSLYAIGIKKDSLECSFTFIGTCPSSTIYNDLTGQCESVPDTDGDGIPDKCDKDSLTYATDDCDDDGIPNDSDTDVDGDGIPNKYDTDNEVPASSETSPTCYELQNIAESRCNYRHLWECVNGPPIYVIDDRCLVPPSPCDEVTESVKRNCDLSTHEYAGICLDDGFDFVKNTLRCVLKDDPPPECDRNWHEVLNTSTNECECATGYTYNTFGDCWASDIDENSTQEEIDADEEAQDLNNDDKKKEIEDEEQKQSDNNASSASFTLDKTRNYTLTSIRRDINTSNSFLSSIKDILSSENNSTSDDIDLSVLDDTDTLLEDRSTFFDDWVNEFDTFAGNINIHLQNIENQYNNALSLFDSTQNFNVPSGSTSGCLSLVIWGKTITLDLCTSFSLLSPIVYFVMTLIFMVGILRFMVNNLLRGLE